MSTKRKSLKHRKPAGYHLAGSSREQSAAESSASKRGAGWQPCGGGWRIVRKSAPGGNY